MHGDVLHDEVAVGDEVMLLERDRPEVVLDRLEDLSQALPTLPPGGVVHHVLGDEVIEHRRIVRLLSPAERFDDVPRAAFTHPVPRTGAGASAHSSRCGARRSADAPHLRNHR